MFKFKELIEKNSDELTKMIVSEHGKVYEDAKGSLIRGLEVVEFTVDSSSFKRRIYRKCWD
ncbi:MAG: hypothetical protein CM1200mP5_1610 [Candidatus Pelagibacterales bacterium]|nr:MAG: hypothetical protein CM1200mP5_1610 [Pelagibacterales bacterium]